MDTHVFLSGEFLETLGIEDFASKKNYGRERGLNPTPTEAQVRAIEKLNQRMTAKSSTKAKKSATGEEDQEESVEFNIMSKPRVILHESPIMKRSSNSLVTHNSRRYGFLLNDVLLITSVPTGGRTSIFSSVDRISVHQIIYLNDVILTDLRKVNENEDPTAFELKTPDRAFYLIAESETDKAVWLEELELAILAVKQTQPDNKLGWYHETIRGSFHSAALLGDLDILERCINEHLGSSLDPEDAAGMTPLHWAAMAGHLPVVRRLVAAGADVDALNKGLNNAILLAAAFAREDVVMFLLDNGAEYSLRNFKDYDCLMMAVVFGIESADINEIVFALKVRGVDLNRQDISGATPLHECSSRNLAISIQTLVSAGADVNAKHGRTGLTPLQLACSNVEPNVETVRSLLDKGACPNWKDTSKRTAFDLVLQVKEVKGQTGDTSNPVGLRKTVDEVSDFVQDRLVVLCEIVRKGGRYTPESVAFLRQSFQDIMGMNQKAWKDATEPEIFLEYVQSQCDEAFLPKSAWTADSASSNCLLCLDKFTMSNRRHHCRSCGVLCCDPCSTKRMRLRATGGSASSSSSSLASSSNMANSPHSRSNVKYEPERVCDSCFNRLSFEAFQWTQAVARVRKEQLRLEAKMQEERSKTLSERRANTNSTSGSTSISPKGGRSSTNTTNDSAGNAMSEAMRGMEERGERLQQVAEKSEQMKEAASEFHSMSKQLKKQQQNKANGSLW